jgi:tetratricopeptide (TPR) repeat protein
LRRKRWEPALEHALNCLQRLHHYPVAHFLLGVALTGLEDYARAADAFRVAISLNPNFPAAHRRLADLLDEKLGDHEAAVAQRRLFLQIRRSARPDFKGTISAPADIGQRPAGEAMPSVWVEGAAPLEESLVIVSGLPRSGTSMVMQMLAAGGLAVLSDGLRTPDEDNPRGYLEYEPVKDLFKSSEWLKDARGKAIKIVAPLLGAVPSGIPCRVILIERDFDEILDSQAKMIERRSSAINGTAKEMDTLDRRELLKSEYSRTISRTKRWLGRRPGTTYLILDRSSVLNRAEAAALSIAEFLGAKLDTERMSAAVEVGLHRNRRR